MKNCSYISSAPDLDETTASEYLSKAGNSIMGANFSLGTTFGSPNTVMEFRGSYIDVNKPIIFWGEGEYPEYGGFSFPDSVFKAETFEGDFGRQNWKTILPLYIGSETL